MPVYMYIRARQREREREDRIEEREKRANHTARPRARVSRATGPGERLAARASLESPHAGTPLSPFVCVCIYVYVRAAAAWLCVGDRAPRSRGAPSLCSIYIYLYTALSASIDSNTHARLPFSSVTDI